MQELVTINTDKSYYNGASGVASFPKYGMECKYERLQRTDYLQLNDILFRI